MTSFVNRGDQQGLVPGTRVAALRYQLKRKLGRGAFSEVWLAWDRTREKDVALKFLPSMLLHDANLVESLRQAARRVQALDHPAAVKVFGMVEDAEHLAIAMECVEGWSLATLRVDRPDKRYTLEELTPWIRQICEVLKLAHEEHSLLHRALKPANLLVNARNQIKITDFTLASLVRTALAQQGAVSLGTPAYFSPQQIKGAPSSPLDDIYSLGATLFDLITGGPPFQSGEIMAQICELPAPKLTERLAQLKLEAVIPSVWEDTIAACLAKDPAKRPQSVAGFLQQLERPPELEKPAESAAAPASGPAPSEKTPTATSPAQTTVPQRLSSPAQTRPPETAAPSPASPERDAASPEVPEGDPAAAAEEPVPSPAASRSSRLALAVFLMSLVGLIGAVWLALSARHKVTGHAGSVDLSFKTGSGASEEVRVIAAQPDGKILVGGKFWEFNGEPLRGLVRLNEDGSLDKAFRPQPIGIVYALACEPGGRILVAGDFSAMAGHIRKDIARLLPDGNLDETFDPHNSADREIRALAWHGPKIVAAGSFESFADSQQGRLVRLQPEGTRDGSFGIGSGANQAVWSLAVQLDGKLLVGGEFISFANEACGRIARLRPDGSLDPDFKPGAGADGAVFALALQEDRKILVAGEFSAFDGSNCSRMVRLNPDGTIDASFKPGEGPDSTVRTIIPQKDGRILIAGTFAHVQGKPRHGVARLKADGSLDAAFDPGNGPEGGYLWCAALQPDGKMLIGGSFTNCDNIASMGIARLNTRAD